ncbi:hypothetical protein Pla175_47950 [Pirellulimonas nuda]|uniref:Putative restriction endonuclease domain-containing protein n=1 Tax=Pirellulimonas nuda TaxID=2528009 RepID=A0A518DIR9_9BACT|nr:Uma2 family endonuclease [Pirellulimonas nuda]QDU91373.1 hypothetical protein Pla175_47950 [Pirellulimonas nuda]
MTAATQNDRVSVEDYLAMERESDVRHEYVGGAVHAMAGSRGTHNTISVNAVRAFGNQLEDSPCQPFVNDIRVLIRLPTHTRYYYPDCLIVCDDPPTSEMWTEKPALVMEVLSRSTRRIDLMEKKDGYLALPSLKVLLYVEQERAYVHCYRRSDNGFEFEAYEGLDAVVPLPEFRIELPLSTLYQRIEFTPESYEPEPR